MVSGMMTGEVTKGSQLAAPPRESRHMSLPDTLEPATLAARPLHERNGAPSAAPKPGHGQEVLLVLPDGEYRQSLSTYLRRQGFKIIEVDSAQAAITRALTGEKIHVVVIAVDLPDMPGIEMLARLRDLGVNAAIALLADAYDQVHEEVALECGAAEFLCKSRRHSIIAKRLHLLAAGTKRQNGHETAAGEDLKVGKLVLKSHCHRALWRGHEVPLTVTEFRIVRLLSCQKDVTLSYREIYDVVHGEGFRAGDGPDGHRTNVRSLIRKIRKRFCSLDRSFDHIENVPGYGYCWRSRPVQGGEPETRAG